MLLYTYISRFSVNPHYRQQLYLRPSFIVFFNFSHKRPTFAFAGKSEYTLGFAQRIAHNGSHAEIGAFRMGGWYHYPRSVPHVRKPPRAGCQNGKFCRFWVLVGDAPEERRKPSEQRCAYARRCSEGVAAPLGRVIFSLLPKLRLVHPALSAFRMCETRGGITTLGAFHTVRKPCVAVA